EVDPVTVRGGPAGGDLELRACPLQRLPADPVPVPSVEVVPGQGAADGGKVHPDLVGAPGDRHAGRQTEAFLRLYNGILGAAGLALRGDAPADDAVGPAADGGVDDAGAQRSEERRVGRERGGGWRGWAEQ